MNQKYIALFLSILIVSLSAPPWYFLDSKAYAQTPAEKKVYGGRINLNTLPSAPTDISGSSCAGIGTCTRINDGNNKGIFIREKCPGNDAFTQCKKINTDNVNTAQGCTGQGRTWCGGKKEYCAASGSECVNGDAAAADVEEAGATASDSTITLYEKPPHTLHVVGKPVRLTFLIKSGKIPKSFEFKLFGKDNFQIQDVRTDEAFGELADGKTFSVRVYSQGNLAYGQYNYRAIAYDAPLKDAKKNNLAQGSGDFTVGFPSGARVSVSINEKLPDYKTKKVRITFTASSRISGVLIEKVIVPGVFVSCNTLPAPNMQCSFETEYVTKNLKVFACLQGDERTECR